MFCILYCRGSPLPAHRGPQRSKVHELPAVTKPRETGSFPPPNRCRQVSLQYRYFKKNSKIWISFVFAKVRIQFCPGSVQDRLHCNMILNRFATHGFILGFRKSYNSVLSRFRSRQASLQYDPQQVRNTRVYTWFSQKLQFRSVQVPFKRGFAAIWSSTGSQHTGLYVIQNKRTCYWLSAVTQRRGGGNKWIWGFVIFMQGVRVVFWSSN